MISLMLEDSIRTAYSKLMSLTRIFEEDLTIDLDTELEIQLDGASSLMS